MMKSGHKMCLCEKTHLGVWMSFCSLAACRQGCTTSSSLMSSSRIPLFSTTLAPSSFSSYQTKNNHLLGCAGEQWKRVIMTRYFQASTFSVNFFLLPQRAVWAEGFVLLAWRPGAAWPSVGSTLTPSLCRWSSEAQLPWSAHLLHPTPTQHHNNSWYKNVVFSLI